MRNGRTGMPRTWWRSSRANRCRNEGPRWRVARGCTARFLTRGSLEEFMSGTATAVPVGRGPELLGQTVVVIGGSSGMGLETARRARVEGAKLILTARDPERLKLAAGELEPLSTATFDANDPAAIKRFFDGLPGTIDHVVVRGGGPITLVFSTWTTSRRAAISTRTCCRCWRSRAMRRRRCGREARWCSWAGRADGGKRSEWGWCRQLLLRFRR